MASVYRLFKTTLPVWASHVRRKGWYFLCDDPENYYAFTGNGKVVGVYYLRRNCGWTYEGEKK